MKRKRPDIIDLLKRHGAERRERIREYVRQNPSLTDEDWERIRQRLIEDHVQESRRRQAGIQSILEAFWNMAIPRASTAILVCGLLICSAMLTMCDFSKTDGGGFPGQSPRAIEISPQKFATLPDAEWTNVALKALGPDERAGRTNQAPVRIDGKDVYVLHFRGHTSARFDVEGQKMFRLVVVNVSSNDAMAMRFQRKREMLNQRDSDLGPIMFPSRSVSWMIEGANNYLATGTVETGTVLAHTPDASVLLIEEGLALEAVLKQLFPLSSR